MKIKEQIYLQELENEKCYIRDTEGYESKEANRKVDEIDGKILLLKIEITLNNFKK